MAIFGLVAVWCALGVAVFLYGGALWVHWLPCLAALGVTSAIYWAGSRRADLAPSPPFRLRALLVALAALAIFQLIPLPAGVVRLLSPVRAEVHAALVKATGPAPATLTLVPGETFRWTLTVVGFILLFLLARELVWRWSARPWVVVAPLVAVGALEGALGLAQVYLGGARVATGTYVYKNHYAGLLELCFPFALMGAVALMRHRRRSHRTPAKPALAACGLLALAAVMLAAIIHSLSRGGFSFVLASLFVMGAASLGSSGSWRGRAPLGAVAVLVVLAFILLPTDALIGRFGQLAAEEIPADTRVEVWRETTRLIAAYPLFGCGLGGYKSGFERYQTVAPMYTVDFAHNDYLQLLAEWGAIGFGVLIALAIWMFRNAVVAAGYPVGSRRRYLGIACLGALTAIALHSLVDFNLYLRANAAVLVWIAGISDGLQLLPANRLAPTSPLYIEGQARVVG